MPNKGVPEWLGPGVLAELIEELGGKGMSVDGSWNGRIVPDPQVGVPQASSLGVLRRAALRAICSRRACA